MPPVCWCRIAGTRHIVEFCSICVSIVTTGFGSRKHIVCCSSISTLASNEWTAYGILATRARDGRTLITIRHARCVRLNGLPLRCCCCCVDGHLAILLASDLTAGRIHRDRRLGCDINDGRPETGASGIWSQKATAQQTNTCTSINHTSRNELGEQMYRFL